jgi:hypothetical protein
MGVDNSGRYTLRELKWVGTQTIRPWGSSSDEMTIYMATILPNYFVSLISTSEITLLQDLLDEFY